MKSVSPNKPRVGVSPVKRGIGNQRTLIINSKPNKVSTPTKEPHLP